MGADKLNKYHLKRAKLKGLEKTQSDWKHSALLIISMNNSHYQNKDSLQQILNWMSQMTYSFEVVVGDYLHRTNQKIYFGMDDSEAISSSLKKGDELIEMFTKTAKEMDITNFKIRRTEEFYKAKEFSASINFLYKLYEDNTEFRNNIDKIIETFLKRLDNYIISKTNAKELCKQYLLEELVIFQILHEENKSIIVYPGKWTIFDSIINGDIGKILTKLSNYLLVELNFVKIK